MMTTRRRNPSGFVRKHPDTVTTRWQGIIKYPDPDVPGQWKQRSATFARRVDAQKVSVKLPPPSRRFNQPS